MNPKDEFAALIAAGEKATQGHIIAEPADDGDSSVGIPGYSAFVAVEIGDELVTLADIHHNECAEEGAAHEACTVNGTDTTGFGDDNAAFFATAANARDTIKLAAEIVEAAGNYRGLTASDPHPVGSRLDALLAKWRGKPNNA